MTVGSATRHVLHARTHRHRSRCCRVARLHTKPSFDIFAKKIAIEDEVWVAAHCLIGTGVTMGSGTVVGSCSASFKDVPPMMVCMGNPFKVIRPRVSGKVPGK